MAEFQEVMKQIKRICNANDYICTDCPMSTQSFCQMSAFDMEGIEAIENIVTAWAAEHPEPVYPAWRDWLRDLYGNPKMTMTDILESPIDPEIAQRLNIVPRRARNGENQES